MILVALDESETSMQALDYALHLAKLENSSIHIITAVEALPPIIGDDNLPEYVPEYHDLIYESYKKMQNKKISDILEKNPELTIFGEVKDGRASKIIIDTANEISADLIVLGHRGASGIINWMLGSVAKQVVESCTVPVLVFKDKALCS